MKQIQIFIITILSVISVSCQNKQFDLSKIQLNENAEKYDLGKNGLFKKIPSSSDSLIEYYSEDNRNLIFAEIPLDSSLSTHISIYNNKIASVEIYAKEKYSLQFAKTLVQRLGTPTTILFDKQTIDNKTGQDVLAELKHVFPNDITQVEEEPNTFKYPYLLFWNKESIYYIFTFHIEWGDGRMRNQYYPLTKDAFRANKIQGYPYPLPAESPLYNYLK